MTTFTDIPIAKITPHPKNVRRDVIVDDELVDSIKEQGILQPIGVVPAGTKYLLIAGHRRLAASKKAGLKQIPAIVHEHLDTEAAQIEAMLVENGRRVDLTATEEAEGYEQLELLGIKPADIALKTGRTKATVASRLKLAKLGEKAKNAIHTGQLTLEDGERIGKLPADVQEKLAEHIGSNNFRWKLEDAVRDIEKQARFDKARAEYESRGLTKIEKPEGGWDYTVGPKPVSWGDDEAKADAWWEGDSYSGPVLVITKIEGGDKAAADRAARDAQYAAEREARQIREEAQAAAKAARIKHAATLGQIKIPAALTPMVALALGRLLSHEEGLFEQIDAITEAAGVKIDRDPEIRWDDPSILAKVTALPPTSINALLVPCLVAVADRLLADAEYMDDIRDVQNAIAYLALIESSGYALPDPDIEVRDSLTAAIAEATTEDAA